MKSYLFAAAITLAAGSASATTINFDDLSGDISGLDLGGVSLNTGQIDNLPNGTPGIIASGFDFSLNFIATFLTAGINSVAVDMGDFGSDEDQLFLRAFDASDNLLGSTTDVLPASVSGMITLSLTTTTDISYIEFFGIGVSGNSVYADNLFFDTGTATVPLPAGGMLLLGGLGAFGAMRRRKKT